MAPEVRRVTIDETVADATAGIEDEHERNRVAAAAKLLPPLVQLQTALDQTVRNLEGALRNPWGLDHAARRYVDQEIDAAARHVAILEAGAAAGHCMLRDIREQAEHLKSHHSRPPSEERPSGAQGGYSEPPVVHIVPEGSKEGLDLPPKPGKKKP